MLYEKRNVFVTTEDVVMLSHYFDIPKVRHHTDWTIDLYLKFIEFLESKPEQKSHKTNKELLCKLKCDILNNLTDFELFISPVYLHQGERDNIGYNVTIRHDPHQYKDVISSIEKEYDLYYRNPNNITIFDKVRINKLSLPSHGKECMVVGMAREDGELLYKLYGINGTEAFGYVTYNEME